MNRSVVDQNETDEAVQEAVELFRYWYLAMIDSMIDSMVYTMDNCLELSQIWCHRY